MFGIAEGRGDRRGRVGPCGRREDSDPYPGGGRTQRGQSREVCDRECSQAPLVEFGAGQEEAAVTAGGWWRWPALVGSADFDPIAPLFPL